MNKPTIKSGKFSAGDDLQCGENVVIDVAEEMIVGDRCVLPNNAHFGGRRIVIEDDFFGYSHWNRRLEVGLGRRDEEDAILIVGRRSTFHDNRIDLSKQVLIGHDVGLSPEVCIYTHGYWQSPLEGFPWQRWPVKISNGVIVGFRSTILPGAFISKDCVIGAGSVVAGNLVEEKCIYAGNPARKLRQMETLDEVNRCNTLETIWGHYLSSCNYRRVHLTSWSIEYPKMRINNCTFDAEALTVEGLETVITDDFRWFAFTNGLRFYTKRPFRKLEKR